MVAVKCLLNNSRSRWEERWKWLCVFSPSPVDRVRLRRQPGLYLEPSDKRDCTEITRTHRCGRGFCFYWWNIPHVTCNESSAWTFSLWCLAFDCQTHKFLTGWSLIGPKEFVPFYEGFFMGITSVYSFTVRTLTPAYGRDFIEFRAGGVFKWLVILVALICLLTPSKAAALERIRADVLLLFVNGYICLFLGAELSTFWGVIWWKSQSEGSLIWSLSGASGSRLSFSGWGRVWSAA